MGAASSMMKFVVEKLREKEKEVGAEGVMNYVVEKSKELPMVLGNLGGNLVIKVGEVFPPETRREQLHNWIQVSKPCIIAAAALLILLCFCRCCCGGGGGGRRSEKMMKAPGRNHRMSRQAFQSNPKSYFCDLRGKK